MAELEGIQEIGAGYSLYDLLPHPDDGEYPFGEVFHFWMDAKEYDDGGGPVIAAVRFRNVH
jgi:hypothetical protein